MDGVVHTVFIGGQIDDHPLAVVIPHIVGSLLAEREEWRRFFIHRTAELIDRGWTEQ